MTYQQDVLLLTERVKQAPVPGHTQLDRICWIAFDVLVLTAIVMLLG